MFLSFETSADVGKRGKKLNALVLRLFALDAHDFLNGVANIEGGNLLPKLACFYLCEIEEVLYQEGHKFCACLLNVLSLP